MNTSTKRLAEKMLERKLEALEEKVEIDRILAKLPADARAEFEGMSLEQVERLVQRHYAHVLGGGRSMLPDAQREALDAEMGLFRPEPHLVKERGTTLEFNAYATHEDADRVLAKNGGSI